MLNHQLLIKYINWPQKKLYKSLQKVLRGLYVPYKKTFFFIHLHILLFQNILSIFFYFDRTNLYILVDASAKNASFFLRAPLEAYSG